MSDRVRSNFNPNEVFTYIRTPKHFDSITGKSIRKVKNNCARLIKESYKGEYQPQTLEPMLNTIYGEFDLLYAQLEGDRSARNGNLQAAQDQGIATVEGLFGQFKLQVANYNADFIAFSEAMQTATGRPLAKNLLFTDEKLEELEERINDLKRSKNGK